MPQWAGWGPGSEVLLARVDYDAQYRNIVKWQNFKQIDAYLRRKGGKSLTIDKFTPLTQQRTVRLDIPWPQAMQGSSPHTRGALLCADGFRCVPGIIPAYAGSTLL